MIHNVWKLYIIYSYYKILAVLYKYILVAYIFYTFVVVVQSLSHVWQFATSWVTAFQDSLSITNSWSSRKLLFIESVMPSSHLILCHPLLILLPPIPPSIRVFSNESTLRVRWPKYWSFSFSISPSNEHSGLISFRIYWYDLLAVQGTLKSLLQHHSSKASILRRSAFFTVQLSHPYLTTGKTIAVTRVVPNSLWPHGLYSPWSSPGQNTGVGKLSLPRGSSQPRDWTQVSPTTGRFSTRWATRKGSYLNIIKSIYAKLTANIILSGERLKACPLRSKIR